MMKHEEIILDKIIFVRDKRVMLDRDLAKLYGATTKRLNEQVKRNRYRFPKDFMFQLTVIEKREVVANYDHLKSLKYSPNLPYAFTEHGAVMLASVLNSRKAIKMNILIVRIFNKIREVLLNHREIMLKIKSLERKALKNRKDIQDIFEQIRRLLIPNSIANRKRIGFKRYDEND